MKRVLLLAFVLHLSNLIYSQIGSDTLIFFSDLRYHSDFERNSIFNFVNEKRDTFNLFLAIDENITTEDAQKYHSAYIEIYDDLSLKKIHSKKINKQIKMSYSLIHNRFLKKYNTNEYFPIMFKNGNYNCVSASMLYAMIFDKLKIPYKVMASSNHVYLIANPGPNSIVVETTNPNFAKAIFTGEFKQQYVNYLRNSKLISELDYKNKSVEEIFEEKFNQVRGAEFNNLPGFQYYNKALTKFQNNNFEEALKLCQKAYFFYPDEQVKVLLYNSLLFQIEKCRFETITDIDYIAQLSRFENIDASVIVGIFNNIIANFLQYTNKEEHCNLLYNRLMSQIHNKSLSNEICFSYNLQMSYRYQNTDKVGKYVAKALEIKGNHSDANIIMESYLNRKLFNISDPKSLLDTITVLESKYTAERTTALIKDYKLMAYLKIARELIEQNKISQGEEYLVEFENICTLPLDNPFLIRYIENTYRSIAVFYFYKGNKTKAKSYVNRGLKFIPNSKLLESAIY